jgi:hypothetical protein
MKVYKLDLHNFKPNGFSVQKDLEEILDRFFSPLMPLESCRIELIVGKGINSKRFINKKNPLRYYTEIYLQKLNLNFREGGFLNGQDGVIIVEW